MSNYNLLLDCLDDCHRVYHAAAKVSFNDSDVNEIFQTNHRGTAHLVNAALEKNIPYFLHVSSVAALGHALEGEISDELTERVQSGDYSAYSESKFLAELEVWRGIEEGLKAVIINPSVILGPGFWNQGSGVYFSQISKGLKYYTKGGSGFVDVRDVVKAMIAISEKEITGERFVVSAENVLYRDIMNMIAVELGKPVPSVHATPAMTEWLRRFDSMRYKIFGTNPRITRSSSLSAHVINRFSSAKLCNETGLEFISVSQTIKDVAEIFRQES